MGVHVELKKTLTDRRVGKAERIALFLYIACLALVIAFHEPWFDESQAWMIARSASWKAILTEVPHYEGHPPLWHLLLAVFAKNGAPYEPTIKTINVIFCASAMGLLLLRSPFPKIIRCLLPFSFYFFYQFGVVSRPYGIFMLAMVLTAMHYRERAAHPWRYILSLMLLCLSTAYGILLAGGLCAVWTGEIVIELVRAKKASRFYRDQRTWALLSILVLALLLAVVLVPAKDVYYDGVEARNASVWARLRSHYIYAVALPFDSFWGVNIIPTKTATTAANYVAGLIGGLVCWVLMIVITAANKKLMTFLAPALAISLFTIFQFASYHHIGISAMFLVVIFWIMLDTPEGFRVPKLFRWVAGKVESDLTRKLAAIAAGVLCIVPVLYSVVSSVNEIRMDYGPTAAADYIKEHHLEGRKIMATWLYHNEQPKSKEDTALYPIHYMPAPHAPVKDQYPYVMGLAVSLMPYFEENIFMNYNVDFPGDLYMHYAAAPDNEAVFDEWRAMGLPEFILDYCPIDTVYSAETLKDVEYVCIAELPNGKPYKLFVSEGFTRIYLRKDLLDEFPDMSPLYQ